MFSSFQCTRIGTRQKKKKKDRDEEAKCFLFLWIRCAHWLHSGVVLMLRCQGALLDSFPPYSALYSEKNPQN